MKDIILTKDMDTPTGCWCIKFINTNGTNYTTQPLTKDELKALVSRIIDIL